MRLNEKEKTNHQGINRGAAAQTAASRILINGERDLHFRFPSLFAMLH